MSFLDDNDHYLGITFITLAFIYALYVTLKTKKALMPYMFYLLYGIGGMLIFREMKKKGMSVPVLPKIMDDHEN